MPQSYYYNKKPEYEPRMFSETISGGIPMPANHAATIIPQP
jgi:hypothetical protein